MSNYSESFFDENNQNASWYKVFQLVKPESKVLDVGCSSGNFGKVLINRKNCAVDGIELDESDATEARKKLRQVWVLNIETDDLKKLGKNKYDVIYFGDVIEHLVHPSTTLKRIKPLLNNGGRVLFSIPNMGHIAVRLDLLSGDLDYTETGLIDKTHLHFYTQKEIFRVFEEAGYRIEKMDFVRKDYPKALIAKTLKGQGLKPNDKFYKNMAKTDASAFQFVGSAAVSTARKHTLPQFGPIDMFESFYNDTKSNYELTIRQLENELLEAQKLLSKKTRLTKKARSIAGKAKRRIKSIRTKQP